MTTSYVNAPATKMLATNCACCGRPLVDAHSVETGVGPDCRKMHGYDEPQVEPDWEAVYRHTDGVVSVAELLGDWAEAGADAAKTMWRLGGVETRRVANLLVNRIAHEQKGDAAEAMTQAVHALGYTTLAARIGARLAQVRVTVDGDDLVVVTPYRAEASGAWRELGGRFERKPRRQRRIPAASKRALWNVLRTYFAGLQMVGPQGLTVIPEMPVQARPVAKAATRHACDGCSGDGVWRGRGKTGQCFRCRGKGYQTDADKRRNAFYDSKRGERAYA